MKLNDNLDYLALISRSLTTDIAPALSSPDAQYKLELIQTVLAELKRREGASGELLRELIAEGRRLRSELLVALGSEQLREPERRENLPFRELLKVYEALTVELDRLCKRLAGAEMNSRDRLARLREVAEWERAWYLRQAALPVPEKPVQEKQGRPLEQDLLEDFLNSERSGEENKPVRLVDLNALSGGFGKQTFLARFRDANGVVVERVVRKSDPVPIMRHGACLLDNEYALLKALAKVGYPAPKPLDFAPAGWQGVDGAFYTMERSPGEVPGHFLHGAKSALPESLIFHLAELLAQLHRVPMETFAEYAEQFDHPGMLEATVSECYRYNLAGWEKYMAEQQHHASPFLVWMLCWLRENLPEDRRAPVMVHGDFNIHNVLAADDRISLVLDWECAGFGCPEQDLAYIRPHITAHMDWQRFVAHYVAAGGCEPKEELMAFGMVYSALRTNLAGNRGTLNLQQGANTDIRYALVELGFTASFMGLALDSTKK